MAVTLEELFASDEENNAEFLGFHDDEIIAFDTPIADLPDFIVVPRIPDRNLNGVSGEEFVGFVDKTYDEILNWRKNLFKLPSGNASKKFVKTLAEWIQFFNTGSDLKGVALKVFHILPALLLQKPSRKSKAKEHLKSLEKRLVKWETGDFESLLAEARVVQARLKKAHSSSPRTSEDVARILPDTCSRVR